MERRNGSRLVPSSFRSARGQSAGWATTTASTGARRGACFLVTLHTSGMLACMQVRCRRRSRMRDLMFAVRSSGSNLALRSGAVTTTGSTSRAGMPFAGAGLVIGVADIPSPLSGRFRMRSRIPVTRRRSRSSACADRCSTTPSAAGWCTIHSSDQVLRSSPRRSRGAGALPSSCPRYIATSRYIAGSR
jgi:hypothetical protein